jgi:hypothetical protein
LQVRLIVCSGMDSVPPIHSDQMGFCRGSA